MVSIDRLALLLRRGWVMIFNYETLFNVRGWMGREVVAGCGGMLRSFLWRSPIPVRRSVFRLVAQREASGLGLLMVVVVGLSKSCSVPVDQCCARLNRQSR